MFTWKSFAIYLCSEVVAVSAVLYAHGLDHLSDFGKLDFPILEVLVVIATGTLQWFGYSPMFKPLGAPDKP